MSVAIAMFFRPLVSLIVLGLVCLPARFAVRRWMKPGRLKNILLFPIRKEPGGDAHR